jgi:hypothetical protein
VADWVTISALATAGGTLALAGATYASVRSGNRSARLAELALQEQRRPVLVNSRQDDREQTVGFADGRWVAIPGGGATIEAATDTVYLAMSLRNVGAGLAVLQGWRAYEVADADGESELGWRKSVLTEAPPATEDFRSLTRDQYISSGDIGIWQGAVRDSADPLHATLVQATRQPRLLVLDLLYTDQVGGQRTISRFGLMPDETGWQAAAARHWYLDASAPR